MHFFFFFDGFFSDNSTVLKDFSGCGSNPTVVYKNIDFIEINPVIKNFQPKNLL